jgi:hypothetical protein
MQTNWLTTGQGTASEKLPGGQPNGAPIRAMGA